MSKVYVIGIGYKPLDRKAREVVLRADHILVSRRLAEVFREYDEFPSVESRVQVINNVDETMEFIRSRYAAARVVLLASGDPLFFGIGRKAVKELGREAVEILPELSSVQVAFARIKEAWDDAFLMSLHGGPDPVKRRRLPFTLDDIPSLVHKHGKLAILTDRENNPASIAHALLSASGLPDHPVPWRSSDLRMYVGERLGYPDERITSGTPGEIAALSFIEPNVVIIISAEARKSAREPDGPEEASALRFGLSENEIAHSRGLITKDEVRAVSLHKLQLPGRGVLWDIGAGSGSISIEAARLSPRLKVFSIERDREQAEHIKENAGRFDVSTIRVIEGSAPDALAGLPDPDRVFIGGSRGSIDSIIRAVSERMPAGTVVVNAATIETLHAALDALREAGFAVDAVQVSVARLKEIGKGSLFAPLNPVFVIRGIREERHA